MAKSVPHKGHRKKHEPNLCCSTERKMSPCNGLKILIDPIFKTTPNKNTQLIDYQLIMGGGKTSFVSNFRI